MTDPAGRTTTYTESSGGDLTSVSDPLSDTTTYAYDASNGNVDYRHDLVSVTGPNGQPGGPDAGACTTIGYDNTGRVASVTDPMGRATTYSYVNMNPSSGNGSVVVTSPAGQLSIYSVSDGQLLGDTTGYGSPEWSTSTTSPGSASTLLDTVTLDPLGRITSRAHDGFANATSVTDPLANTATAAFSLGTSGSSFPLGMDAASCSGTALGNAASHDCGGSNIGPAPIAPGSEVVVSSIPTPPDGLSYAQYDTSGNLIWTTTGIYSSSGSLESTRTAFELFNGDSVKLADSTVVTCTSRAPSPSLPCAEISADQVVTQLAYNTYGDLTSSSTPDGNGTEVATTTYSYDQDGEKLSETAPDGNLSGANAANYTTTWTYDADGHVLSSTSGGGSGSTVAARTTSTTYDANGNPTGVTRAASVDYVGATSTESSGPNLALPMPPGTRAGDEALLATTVSAAPGASMLTTLAGGGAAGLRTNVAARAGQLDKPFAVVADAAGDVFIADQSNARVEEIPATSGTYFGVPMLAGNIYTIAGSQSGAVGDTAGVAGVDALLTGPSGLAFDSAGNLYIADYSDADVFELARSSCSSGCNWGLSSMTAGDLYRIIGSQYGAWGHSSNGTPGTSALLGGPVQLAFDAGGDLYVADSNNDRIAELAATTEHQWGLSMTADDLYTVAGTAGTSGTPANGESATAAVLNQPYGIAIDSSGDMVIANSGDSVVNLVPATACSSSCSWNLSSWSADVIYTIAGSGSTSPSGDGGLATSAGLNWPSSVSLDQSHDLVVADDGNNRVQEVAYSNSTRWGQSMTAWHVYTVAGSASGASGYSGDGGIATAAEFANLAAISVAPSGDIFAADTTNNAVRVVSPTTSGTTPTPSTPSGYSMLTSVTSGQTTTYLYDHQVAVGDSGVSVSYSAAGPVTAVLGTYRDFGAASVIDATSSGSASGTSVSASPLGVTHVGDMLVVTSGVGQQGGVASLTMPAGTTVRAAPGGLDSVGESLADIVGPVRPGETGSPVTTSSRSGQLTSILVALSPGSVTTTTSYDADDEAVLSTDPDGNSTLTCHDANGNVTETVPPVGVAAGGLTASSCGSSTLYPNGCLAASGTEALPVSLAPDATLSAYDPSGNTITEVTPAPQGQSGTETTTQTYDNAGQLVSVTAPPPSASPGAPSQVTTYEHDADGRLSAETSWSQSLAVATTVYCYDANGDRTAVVAPDGNSPSVQTCSTDGGTKTGSAYETSYSYDSVGELSAQLTPATSAAPSGATTSYTYDGAGHKLTSTDPNGVTTTSTYTPLGEVATITYSGSSAHSVDYSYDADGQMSEMSDASGASSYGYDPFGETTTATNGAGQTVTYAYDLLGLSTDVTYPLGSPSWALTSTLHRSYDPAGRLVSVTDFEDNTIAVTDTADGLPSEVSLGPSGESISSTYDSTDSPASIALGGVTGTTLGFSYSYSPAGNVSQETDTPSASYAPASYNYDALSRVTADTPGSMSALSYSTDASGNLTTLPTEASATAYDHASELTSSTLSGQTTSYSYNADGERLSETQGSSTTVSATYNGAQELTSYSNASANMSSATYDGSGLRSADTVGSSSQGFVFDTRPSVPQLLLDGSNAYLYAGANAPAEQVNLASGAVSYLVADALGSVRGVLSPAGGLLASTAYDAWGNPETSGGLTALTPFGFAGGYTDPTGLVYLIHRYYDPTTGQFLTVDPDLTLTQKPYLYAGDNPTNNVDPVGDIACDADNPGSKTCPYIDIQSNPRVPAEEPGSEVALEITVIVLNLDTIWPQSRSSSDGGFPPPQLGWLSIKYQGSISGEPFDLPWQHYPLAVDLPFSNGSAPITSKWVLGGLTHDFVTVNAFVSRQPYNGSPVRGKTAYRDASFEATTFIDGGGDTAGAVAPRLSVDSASC